MTPKEELISIVMLRSLVEFDAKTCLVFWKRRGVEFFQNSKTPLRMCNTWNSRFAGKPAFAHVNGAGYFHGAILGEKMLAHRVIYALANEKWPEFTIDHINGNRKDNRPENLRDVTHIENMRNQPVSKASDTGITGVHFDKNRNKYEAHITVCGTTNHLGRFETIEEAKLARDLANTEFGFHQNHGRA